MLDANFERGDFLQPLVGGGYHVAWVCADDVTHIADDQQRDGSLAVQPVAENRRCFPDGFCNFVRSETVGDDHAFKLHAHQVCEQRTPRFAVHTHSLAPKSVRKAHE